MLKLKKLLNKNIGGIIILTYCVYSIQFLRTFWLSGFSKDVLIEWQLLSLVVKFSPLFFLGYENFILMQLSRSKKKLNTSDEFILLSIGISVTLFFVLLISFTENNNYFVYVLYLCSLPILAILKIRLRLLEKNVEILIIELIISILIWLGIFYEFNLPIILNIIGVLSIIYFFIRNRERSVFNVFRQTSYSVSSSFKMLFASNFVLFFIQTTVFYTKSIFLIDVWSDFVLSFTIAQGMWYGFGGITWYLQPKLWSMDLKTTNNYQLVYTYGSIFYSIICIISLKIILFYFDISQYIINTNFIFIIFISLLPINLISPSFSYLIKKDRFYTLIVISSLAILILVISFYLRLKIQYTLPISTFSYALMIYLYKKKIRYIL